jgi:hypothetical protein
MAGHRTPTPSTITAAANSPFPANQGLDYFQMSTAISGLGFIADRFVPHGNPALFKAKLIACLQSNLPVILFLEQPGQDGAHAVTLTGYGELPAARAVALSETGLEQVLLRGASVDTVYVHDDNLGAHAHYELIERDDRIFLYRGRSDAPSEIWWTPDEWEITCALVPKPQKLRMPIEALFAKLTELRRVFETIFPTELPLDFGVRFARGVHYRRDILEWKLDSNDMRNFQFGLSLPRHVGIVTANRSSDGSHLCDAVVDVTEVERAPSSAGTLAIVAPAVPRQSEAAKSLQELARSLACSHITGPR